MFINNWNTSVFYFLEVDMLLQIWDYYHTKLYQFSKVTHTVAFMNKIHLFLEFMQWWWEKVDIFSHVTIGFTHNGEIHLHKQCIYIKNDSRNEKSSKMDFGLC